MGAGKTDQKKLDGKEEKRTKGPVQNEAVRPKPSWAGAGCVDVLYPMVSDEDYLANPITQEDLTMPEGDDQSGDRAIEALMQIFQSVGPDQNSMAPNSSGGMSQPEQPADESPQPMNTPQQPGSNQIYRSIPIGTTPPIAVKPSSRFVGRYGGPF